jgi:hypothetical protein
MKSLMKSLMNNVPQNTQPLAFALLVIL